MIIKGLKAAQDAIGEFRFPEFRLLREFHLFVTPSDGYPTIDVEICSETDKRSPPAKICMKFHRVSSLQIREFGGEARIAGFDIADLSDRQWENIRWQVFDFEQDVINFYADDAEIVSASLLDHQE